MHTILHALLTYAHLYAAWGMHRSKLHHPYLQAGQRNIKHTIYLHVIIVIEKSKPRKMVSGMPKTQREWPVSILKNKETKNILTFTGNTYLIPSLPVIIEYSNKTLLGCFFHPLIFLTFILLGLCIHVWADNSSNPFVGRKLSHMWK